MPRRIVLFTALATLAACSEPPPTAPLDDLPVAAAPNNDQKQSIALGAFFALLGAERVQVCLAVPLDDPGNGDARVFDYDDDSGFYLFERQSSTSRALISVYATIADYVADDPYLVAEGHAREKRSAGGKSAQVFHAHGQAEDGTKVDCKVVFPAKRTFPGGEAVRSIRVH